MFSESLTVAERAHTYLVSDQTRKEVWDNARSAEYAERHYGLLGNENLKRDRLCSLLAIGSCGGLVVLSIAMLSGAVIPWMAIALSLSSFLLAGVLIARGGFARKALVWTFAAKTYGQAGRKFRYLLDVIDRNEIEDEEARVRLMRLTMRTKAAIERSVKSARNWRGSVPDDLRRHQSPPLPGPATPPPRPTPPPSPPEPTLAAIR